MLDQAEALSKVRAVHRSDVPFGTALVYRFIPVLGEVGTVRITCPRHPESYIESAVVVDEWRIRGLAEIQSCLWPRVMGWWVALEDQAVRPELVVEDVSTFRLMTNRELDEFVNFLGAEGLGGFSVDLGRLLGYALPDGTRLSLRFGDEVVARGEVTGSPLTVADRPCWLGKSRVNLDPMLDLHFQRHFDRGNWHLGMESWREAYVTLGLGIVSDAQEQWARYLTAQAPSVDRIVRSLEARARADLGVTTVCSLPHLDVSSLREHPQSFVPESRDNVCVTECEPGLPSSAVPRHAPDSSQFKVVVAGLTSHRSGLGQNARNSIRVLADSGVHACQAPFFPAVGGWNRDLGLNNSGVHDLRDHAALLHLPMDAVVATLCAQPALMTSQKLVGFYMWETETIPAPLLRSLQVVDEVWTATDFVAESFRRVTSTPVRVVGHAVAIDEVQEIERASLGIAESDFVVHFAFDANSTVARKNPGAAIRSFQRAFPGDRNAKFVLKVRNWSQAETLAYSGDPSARDLMQLLTDEPRIRLVTGEHSHAFALGLVKMADCFLSLHRSEGFGYGIAEAMLLGVPVVATAYSGNLDLTLPENSWLVPWEQVDVLPGEYFFWDEGMFWAEADGAAAAEALREVRRGGAGVECRVRAARVHALRETSLKRLAERYVGALGRP